MSKRISDIDEFLEKEGYSFIVQEFLETEQFKEAVSKHYAELVDRVEEMHSDLPGHLLTEAVRLWKEAEYTKETFESDIIVNVKMRLHLTINTFKKYIDMLPRDEANRILTNNNSYSALMTDVDEITSNLIEETLNAHYAQIFPQHICDEVVEEILNFITTHREGGMIVFLGPGSGTTH